MSDDTNAGCYYAPDNRSVWQRKVWPWLGFGRPWVECPDEVEGFAPGAITTNIVTHVDWKDRLRILISGKIMTQSRTLTDVVVDKAQTISMFRVLPPGAE